MAPRAVRFHYQQTKPILAVIYRDLRYMDAAIPCNILGGEVVGSVITNLLCNLLVAYYVLRLNRSGAV